MSSTDHFVSIYSLKKLGDKRKPLIKVQTPQEIRSALVNNNYSAHSVFVFAYKVFVFAYHISSESKYIYVNYQQRESNSFFVCFLIKIVYNMFCIYIYIKKLLHQWSQLTCPSPDKVTVLLWVCACACGKSTLNLLANFQYTTPYY